MKKSSLSRRKFLGASILSTAGLSFLPQLGFSAEAAPVSTQSFETIHLGFIGVGRQSGGLINNMMKVPGVEVIAGADVYAIKRERFILRVNKNYTEQGRTAPDIKVYEDYKELLANPDVDAVVIASPDHWHAMMAINACKAKKDIYLEKPLTFTIKEGQELIKAVRYPWEVCSDLPPIFSMPQRWFKKENLERSPKCWFMWEKILIPSPTIYRHSLFQKD